MEPKHRLMNTKALMTLIFFAALSIFFKVIPHIPNFSPLMVFFLYLGNALPRRFSLLGILTIATLADFVVSINSNFPSFGTWTLFTYSGFLMIGLCGSLPFISVKKWSFVISSICLSFVFWVWTNFGTWILSGMYPHSSAGLIACYLAALPFLENTLLSSFLWGSVFVSLTRIHLLPSYPLLFTH